MVQGLCSVSVAHPWLRLTPRPSSYSVQLSLAPFKSLLLIAFSILMNSLPLHVIELTHLFLITIAGVIDASDAVDISVAVATPNGLITPIVTGAILTPF